MVWYDKLGVMLIGRKFWELLGIRNGKWYKHLRKFVG